MRAAAGRPVRHAGLAGRASRGTRAWRRRSPGVSSGAIEGSSTEGEGARPAVDQAFAEARARFLSPPRAGAAGWVLLATLALFAVSMLHQRSASQLLLLVGVLLFHEAGHWVGMRALGYADVRIFFIPFLGAAASGRDPGAAPWKEGVVLLLGPVPGILLSLPLLLFAAAARSRLAADAGSLLLVLNALNLLPIAPLDGGRLFQRVLFSRHRLLEVLFLGGAGLGLLAFGVWHRDWPLAVLGVLVLGTAPQQFRVLQLAHQLVCRDPGLAAPPSELDEPRLRALHDGARALSILSEPKAAGAAFSMRQLHDAARRRPPSLGISALLGICWAGAMLAAFLGLGLIALGPRAYAWEESRDGEAGLAAQFPGKPARTTQMGAASEQLVQLEASAGGSAFTLAFTEPIPEDVLPDVSEAMAAGIGGSADGVLDAGETTLGGFPARRYRMREEGRELLTAIGAVNGRVVVMQVRAGPRGLDLDAAEHFFGSLRVLPPPPPPSP